MRLACIMAHGWIDSASSLQELIAFARDHKVEQLTIRPSTGRSTSRELEAFNWTEQHHLRPEELHDIRSFLESDGRSS